MLFRTWPKGKLTEKHDSSTSEIGVLFSLISTLSVIVGGVITSHNFMIRIISIFNYSGPSHPLRDTTKKCWTHFTHFTTVTKSLLITKFFKIRSFSDPKKCSKEPFFHRTRPRIEIRQDIIISIKKTFCC